MSAGEPQNAQKVDDTFLSAMICAPQELHTISILCWSSSARTSSMPYSCSGFEIPIDHFISSVSGSKTLPQLVQARPSALGLKIRLAPHVGHFLAFEEKTLTGVPSSLFLSCWFAQGFLLSHGAGGLLSTFGSKYFLMPESSSSVRNPVISFSGSFQLPIITSDNLTFIP